MDVEWWVEDQLVIEESFNLKAKSSGTLQPQFWKMGQTVRDFPENSFSQICYCFITVLEQKHTLSTCQFYLVIFFQKVVHTYLNFRAKVHSLFSKKMQILTKARSTYFVLHNDNVRDLAFAFSAVRNSNIVISKVMLSFYSQYSTAI